MIASPRKRRRRAVLVIAGIVVVVAGLLGFFLPGPTGMLRIYARRRQTVSLQHDLGEMKNTEVILRSDIKDYLDTARVRKIVTERMKMVPKDDTLSGKP